MVIHVVQKQTQQREPQFKPFKDEGDNKIYYANYEKLPAKLMIVKNALYIYLNAKDSLNALAAGLANLPVDKMDEKVETIKRAKIDSDEKWEKLKTLVIRNVLGIIDASKDIGAEEKKMAKKIVSENIFYLEPLPGDQPHVAVLKSKDKNGDTLNITFSIGCGYMLIFYAELTKGKIDMYKPIKKLE